MVIFAALFIVITTILFGAFGQRIQDFLLENILGRLFKLFSRNIEAGEEVEASTVSPSSTITITGSEFDVFLSFRGEDTRKGFTGHLYEGLQLRGVSTFKDDVNLDKGKEIDRLLEYIEKSKIFVVILSKRFAESRWCLKEVTKSIECGKEIVPVFFGVEPSDVRNLSGPFKSAFKKHESNKKENQQEVEKWKKALKMIGNLAGFTLNEKNGDETELKLAIIHKVLDKRRKLLVAKHPVGIESRLQDVVKMLENESINGIHVVGICGMGGLGKTTIAMAVYNEYLTKGFNDASCFLSNIREKSGQPNGLVDLQKQFIRDIFKQKDISLRNVAEGNFFIKDKTNHKRVLLILDDIDSVEQLNALAGEKDWYGSGSVIIITTRDKKVLVAHNVKEHEIYEPPELNEEQSRELFLKHAFNGQEPKGDYLQLSKEAVAAASGLPLTLEVLGSLLTCDMHIQEWKYTLEKLKNIPPKEVFQRLKLSYDRLDKYEQKIFLDISCLFIGWRKEYVTYMWDGRRSFPEHAIRVLEQRSLIKIDEKSGEFWMHDQIRDMGRAIVEEESSAKAEKQSRIWNSKDSLNLLQKKVPAAIAAEGIRIHPQDERHPIITADCFQNMSNLRYFDAKHLDFQGTLESFPRDLKWLELWGCKFDSPPSDQLNLEQLVILDLYETNYMAQILINRLQFQTFENLKVLKIDDPAIKISPDFTNIPCLVELSLSQLKVTMIDESIGTLKDLVYLEIKFCRQLEKLPDSVGQLKNLKRLFLLACHHLCSLPEKLGGMENLRELILNDLNIEFIPDSVGQLKNLERLSLKECHHLCSFPRRLGDMKNLREVIVENTTLEVIPDSVGQLKNLERLSLLYCYNLRLLPKTLGGMENLRELIFEQTEIEVLPDSVGQLKNLERLSLEWCCNFRSLPERLGDMENLRELVLDYTKIEAIPDSIGQLKNLERLSLFSCYYLHSLPESLGGSKKLKELILNSTHIEVIPDSIGQLKNIESLLLEWCCILRSLPERLGDMENLRELILDQTQIEVIPDSVGQLKNLERLSVSSGSYFHSLPESLGDMKNLRELILHHTQIEVIPDSIGQLKNLEILSLTECQHLCSLPESLGDVENLRELILDDTQIEVLPDSIGQLKNLERLILCKCFHLYSLPERLGDMENLRELILDETQIEVIPHSVGQLKNLVLLSLRNCHRLRSLPERLSDVENLRELILDYTEIEVIPDLVGQLKNLIEISVKGCRHIKKLPYSFTHLVKISEFIGSSLELIELSDRGQKSFNNIDLIDDGIKELPDCIKEMEYLKNLWLSCEMLVTLPNWMERLSESLIELFINSKHLTTLPDCVGRLYRLEKLSLECECENFFILPDLLGRLKNLRAFSLKSKNLIYLPATIHESWRKLKTLDLSGCENLEDLTAAASIKQKESMTHLPSLEQLYLSGCKRLEYLPHLPSSLEQLCVDGCTNLRKINLSGCEKLEDLTVATSIQQKDSMSHLSSLRHLNLNDCKSLEYLPQLPSSLEYLSASACSNLRKISDVSNLKRLIFLHLQGCKLLEDVPGLQNISNNLTELALPGPYDLMACCRLSHDFKNKVFKEMDFAMLEAFLMSGSIDIGLLRGQQQLHFMTPSLSFDWFKNSNMRLELENVDSPVPVEIMADDILVFEKSLEPSNDHYLGERQEDLMNIGEEDEKHCYTIQVTIEEASQLQRIELLLYLV